MYTPKRRHITEAQFVKAFITDQLPRREACAQLGIGLTTFFRMTEFRKKYSAELRAIAKQRYAEPKFGNRYGSKDQPSRLLDRQELVSALERGIRLPEMARAFGCSEFLLSRNIEHHHLTHLAQTGRLPLMLREYNLPLLERLEVFCPGLMPAARNFEADPDAFFTALHQAHVRLIEAQWLIKRLGRRSGYYTGHHKGRCWSSNRHEACLAIALEDAGMTYTRQVALSSGPGPLMVDFLIEDEVFVEVDGSHHQLAATKLRDAEKERQIATTGLPLLRFSEKQVWRHTRDVIDEIRRTVTASKTGTYWPSNTSESKKSGTSRSRKTKATSPTGS